MRITRVSAFCSSAGLDLNQVKSGFRQIVNGKSRVRIALEIKIGISNPLLKFKSH